MAIKEVNVKYPLGHTIKSKWALSNELYCPSCGKNAVWVEQSEGDFYVGPDYVCIECKTSFNMPIINEANEQVIKQLK